MRSTFAMGPSRPQKKAEVDVLNCVWFRGPIPESCNISAANSMPAGRKD
jgi:hypothetical protein